MAETKTELKEKVVNVSRVAKVVKGGRTFRFSVMVVVGDENGHIGVGTGKSAEVPEAIKKATEDAKKNLVEVSLVNGTLPHEYTTNFGSSKVIFSIGSDICGSATDSTGISNSGNVKSSDGISNSGNDIVSADTSGS